MAAQTSPKEGDLNTISTAQAVVSDMGGTIVNHGRLLSVSLELEVYRKNLQDIEEELYSLRMPEEHILFELHKEVDSLWFECCQQCDELSTPSSPSKGECQTNSACKLRKQEIPTFNGNVMKWDHFWRRSQKAVP